ncbi:uncharacterized protein FIBRA_05297 [Fibroporia radiculosa]|uniref:EF-hand domain-containing protein n=1 Tax=Fibroporia radiculosa TaxID=599839 RepID=J4GQR0_9APHY|nr:uncharacterized protein FIBRA_05297 [Fibroporia radiculosa]CCM03175.1 predicted protein [Fibroporia radiculosa]
MPPATSEFDDVKPSRYFVGDAEPLTCVAFFPDSKTIISGSYESRIRLWNVASGEQIGEPLRGHKVAVFTVAVSRDGTKFASGGGDGKVLIWNAATRVQATKPIQAYSNWVKCVAFSPDGTRLASIAGKIVRIWDVETGALVMEIESWTQEGHVAFSPDGSKIAAVSSFDKSVRVWSTSTGEAAISPLAGHENVVQTVAWFPDGHRLITASRDATIRIWDLNAGSQIGDPLGGYLTWMPTSASVSPDGNIIAAVCGEDRIRLWNATTRERIGRVLWHASPIQCMAFSPNSCFIASGCGDKKICLWDIRDVIPNGSDSSRPLPALEPLEDNRDAQAVPSGFKSTTMNSLSSKRQIGPERDPSQAPPSAMSHEHLQKPASKAKAEAETSSPVSEHGCFSGLPQRWKKSLSFWNNTKQPEGDEPHQVSPASALVGPQQKVPHSDIQGAAQDVLDELGRYTTNEIPIRLIHLPTMELVGRDFVRSHFLGRINEISESVIAKEQRSCVPPYTREKAVSMLVEDRVKYGILSHRWLNTGEPSYQDMMERSLRTSQNQSEGGRRTMKTAASGEERSLGYRKLLGCCEEAKRLGLDFLWSDTCCIDKTSSAELDESIRSMFRWYRNSTICIVYLGQTTVMEDMRADEWFLRGWTLQELLAPRTMKFFNKEWQPLTEEEDDKEEDTPILTILHEITGIPEIDIEDFSPAPQNVDKRMTWAAPRKTTRAEDAAYSLMGIFDVSLQIAYGEGGERAFSRLIEAIMQAGGDTSVLNWAGHPAKHHASRGLPASPASYVGHPDIVQIGRLDISLTSRGLRVPLIILPLEITNKPKFDGRPVKGLKFRCPDHEIGDVNIDSGDYPFRTESRYYALGIFHYIPAEDGSNPGLPKQIAAYLLERNEVPAQDSTLIGLSRHYRSTDDGWRRIPTAFIYLELPGVPDFASLCTTPSPAIDISYSRPLHLKGDHVESFVSMSPSNRDVFEASLSGAQDRSYIPRLRSDPLEYHTIPHNLQEFRAQEGPERRERRLRKLWSRLPKRTSPETELDDCVAEAYPVKSDGVLTPEGARKLQEMYEAELCGRCGAHTRGFLHRSCSWSEFLKYADAKEAELWHIFNDELDVDGNGRLDTQELIEALQKAGVHLSTSTIADFMTFLTLSPHAHAVSFAEFRDFFLLLPRRASPSEIFRYYEVRRATDDQARGAARVTMEGDVSLSAEDMSSSRPPLQAEEHASIPVDHDTPDDDEYESEEDAIEDGSEHHWLEGSTAAKFLLAGGFAGGVSRTCTAPFDRLKIFLITRPPDLGGVALDSKAPVRGVKAIGSAVARIYAEGGVRAFWTGNGLSVAKILPESAIKFLAYESSKRMFAKYWDHVDDPREISGVSRFLSGGMGGISSQLSIYPIETLKTQMMSSTGEHKRTLLSAARRVWALGGIRAFYRGLTIGLVGVFPYSAIDMSTFEALKLAYLRSTRKDEPGVLALLAFGSVSGSIGATSVYPLNLVRTRLQASGSSGHPQRYSGIMDVVRKTYARDGWRGFYRGLLPTLAKVVPAVSISYVVYESSKKKLGV